MFANPKKHIAKAYIGEGMIVVDFGAAAGYHVFEAAKKVGEYGKIYALDVQTDLLRRIKNEADRQGLKNIEIIHANVERENGSGLMEHSVDRVFIINRLFQADDNASRVRMFNEALRILKPTGKLVVVDWLASFGHLGPHPDQVISRDEAATLGRQNSFVLEKEFPAGDHHYGLLFTPIKK
ncbi:MAG: methyltransferase domain-containing protein [Candidatus Pacebacteria bacterium]|nr:methyltransferase domain-containing protein [Candidatus Paceibacterota bacterium]